jgi:hypothetical protein
MKSRLAARTGLMIISEHRKEVVREGLGYSTKLKVKKG